MTSAQTMRTRPPLVAMTLCVLALVLTFGSGCQRETMTAPTVGVAPYETLGGDVLWAVVPPRNESGTTVVDNAVIGDNLVAAADQVRGIRVVPINRTVRAMRALGIEVVDGPGVARTLAREMGVDGIIVANITAYDPYDPPKLGLTLALFVTGATATIDDALGDPFRMQLSAVDTMTAPGVSFGSGPSSVAGGIYDARNHDVLMRVEDYAAGRTEIDSVFGWRAFLVSMDLYTEFVAHEAVNELLGREWLRLARTSAREMTAQVGGSP